MITSVKLPYLYHILLVEANQRPHNTQSEETTQGVNTRRQESGHSPRMSMPYSAELGYGTWWCDGSEIHNLSPRTHQTNENEK